MSLFRRRLVGTAFAAAAATAAACMTPVVGSAVAHAAAGAPVLTAPADNTTTPVKDVVLKWQPVAGASGYQVQISPNGDWTNNTVSLAHGGNTVRNVYEVPLSLPHASYFWRVRATVAGQVTDWSQTDQFLHDWYQPFTLLKAPDGTDPSVSWTPVQEASLYRVRFSSSPTFKTDDHICWTDTTSFTPYAVTTKEKRPDSCFSLADLVTGTKYYWEVMAFDDSTATPISADTGNDPGYECAEPQPECNAYRFYGNFTFSAPTAGDIETNTVTGLKTSWHNQSSTTDCTGGVCPMTPTFSWDPVPGANDYTVHVYRDPYGTNTMGVYETAWPEVTPRDTFLSAQAGQAYYWDVTAGICKNSDSDPECGAAGATTDSSVTTCTASTDPGAAPCVDGLSVSPAGAKGNQTIDAGTTGTVTLSGANFASGATVQASGGVGTVGTPQVTATTVSFSYAAPATPQPVTFTVTNPDNQVSNTSPTMTVTGAQATDTAFSDTLTFKVANGPVNLASPAAGATLHEGHETFSWGDYQEQGSQGSIDARNYRLQVASDSHFRHVVLDNPSIDMTQYTDPKSLPAGSYYWRVAPLDENGNLLTWSGARRVLSNDETPTLRLQGATKGIAAGGRFHIAASTPVRGVSDSSVKVRPTTGGKALAGRLTQGTSSTRWVFTPKHRLVVGQTYNLSVSAAVTDAAGNVAVVKGKGVRVHTAADDRSKSWSFSKAWSRRTASGAMHGSYVIASGGHTAKLAVVGSTVSVFGCKGPRLGSLSVSISGHHATTVSERQSFTRCGELLWKGTLPDGQHSLRLRSTHGSATIDEVKVG